MVIVPLLKHMLGCAPLWKNNCIGKQVPLSVLRDVCI